MIKSVQIKNFQSHKETKFEFKEGLNVITGSSDSGKTTVLRALEWVFKNRPLGEEFKSYFAKATDPIEVKVVFDNGELTKGRIKGSNYYIVGNKKLEAIKTDVPEEVQNLVNILDHNIQTQHQAYFLLQDSPGEVARKLNELVGLDIIDILFRNLNSKILEANRQVREAGERKKELTESIDSLSYIDQIEKVLEKIEKKLSHFDVSKTKYDALEKLLNEYTSIIEEKGVYMSVPEMENIVTALISQVKSYLEQQVTLMGFKALLTTFESVHQSRNTEKRWLSVEPLHKALIKKVTNFHTNKSKATNLTSLLRDYEQISTLLEKEKKKYNIAVSEYIKTLTKEKICPTCGNSISNSTLKELKERLLCVS